MKRLQTGPNARPRGWDVLGIVLILTATAWGGSHCVRARCRCGIPGQYAYGAIPSPPPKRTISTAGLSLRQDTPIPAGSERGAVKAFQMQDGVLQIDHCAVSRVAVLLDHKGRCRVNLQADQNTPATLAAQDEQARQAGTPQGGSLLQTSQFKRNEFHVVVRGYGVPPSGDPNQSTLGKPVVFRVEVCPFWVQRGESRDLVVQIDSADVREYFDQVNHVEVDFWYR